MAQITVYLDPDTDRQLRAAAAAAGQSLSQWITGLIRARTATTWPEDVAALAGAWVDDEAMVRSWHDAPDTPRESW